MEHRGRASRFLIESFVIVSSILLAFAIDAGWDARNERREEAEILSGLEREFSAIRENLVRGLEQHQGMLDAMETILRSIEVGRWTSEEWPVDAALGRLAMPPTSDLGDGVLDALINAGRLELLRDAVLRERLARWPGYYEELLEDQIFSRQIVLDHVLPYFAASGHDLSALLVAGTMVVDDPAEAWPTPIQGFGADADRLRALLADPRFRAVVQMRYSYWHHAGGEYRAAVEAAEQILARLESGD